MVSGLGASPTEGESLLGFGRPKKVTEFSELTVSGKMYLLYLRSLMHLRENESSRKAINIFRPKQDR